MNKKNLNYNFNKFNMSTLKDNSAICLIAKRNSGKSWLVKDILYHKRDIPVVIIISPTEKLGGFYNTFIPNSFIYNEYKSSILNKIFKRQEVIIKKNKENEKKNKKQTDPRILIVMDDCLASKNLWSKDHNIYELLCNGRHYYITFILTMQYSLGIQPELRNNFDFIFLLAEDFANNQKRLYEHWTGIFETFDTFRKVFIQMTTDFGCMVLNSQIKNHDITEKVFWYKASSHDKFIFANNEMQDFHEKNYNKLWNQLDTNKKNLNSYESFKLVGR